MAIGRLSVDDTGRADAVHLIAKTARNTLGRGVVAQTEEILGLIESDLLTAKADHSDITRATIWLRDLSEFSQMNRIWSTWIADASLARRLILEDQNLPERCDIRIGITLLPK